MARLDLVGLDEPATLELIVAGYGTAYALLLIVGGRLGDAYGRRTVFTFGLAGFTLPGPAFILI